MSHQGFTVSLGEHGVGRWIAVFYVKQLQLKRAKRALIVVFDSSYPFSVGERRLLRVPFRSPS
jgi:hypothetical protein